MNVLASFTWNYLFSMPNFMFLMGGLIGITAIIASAWSRTATATELTRLKQMMVERGYSPTDILRVVHVREQPERKPQVHAAVLRTKAAAGQGCSEDACC
jgi:hypothetical protein